LGRRVPAQGGEETHTAGEPAVDVVGQVLIIGLGAGREIGFRARSPGLGMTLKDRPQNEGQKEPLENFQGRPLQGTDMKEQKRHRIPL